MKLVFFNDFILGVVRGDAVVDVSESVRAIPHTSPQDLLNRLIADFASYKGRLQEASQRGTGVPLSQVRLRPPTPKPYDIVAMAVNYMEDGRAANQRPKTPSTKRRTRSLGMGTPLYFPTYRHRSSSTKPNSGW